MAEEVVNLKDFKKEQKKRERKEKCRKKLEKTWIWINEHQELALVIIPAGIAGVSYLVKSGVNITKGLIKTHNLNKELKLKDLRIYDRSLNKYFDLRRKLTNDELLEINKRKKNGESLADILNQLKVLA